MERESKVSVVITCYNQARFLQDAIESVFAQTHKRFEIIVVDDESSDDPGRVARDYGVSYIRQKNQGVAAARNTGLKESKGQYVVFLDADDRLLSQALETNLKTFVTHPDCAFVFGHHIRIDDHGSPLAPEPALCPDRNHFCELLKRNYIGPPAVVMYKRDVFDSVGPLDNSASLADDYEIYLRIARSFPIHCHHKEIVEYRLHDTNTSRNFELTLQVARQVLLNQRKYLKGNAEQETALKRGLSNVRQAYSDQVVNEIRRRVKARNEWTEVLRGVAKLARHHPQDLVRHGQRKLQRILHGAK